MNVTLTCSTRALKNAKRIRAFAPHIIPAKEPAAGYSSIVPLDVLARLHKMSDQELAISLKNRPELLDVAKKMRPAPVPTPSRAFSLFGDPPFKGTLHFVQLTLFVEANNSTHSVSIPDIQTAIQYTKLAAKPLAAYCAQYGANRIDVSDDILQFGPSIVAHYNDDNVQSWVNQIISDNHLPKASSCIVILNPREILNTDADPTRQGILGYHDKADAPYLFVNVLGTGLTVQDRANVYADTLSHEIAEMVCDPDASWFNHEVCDGCAGNCNNNWRNFFADPDATGVSSYIQSAKQFPPAFPFIFFTASVARPSHADDCPAPDNACAYGPFPIVPLPLMHVVGIAGGLLWHTIRNPDGSWVPAFGLVESVEQNDPGAFSAISCAGVGNELHVVGIAGGLLWHTIRSPDGSWVPAFGLVESVEQNDPGAFSAISCAGVGNELHVVGIAGGLLWHTIRNPDGSWVPAFGLVESVEQNDPGAFSAISCAGVTPE